MTAKRSNQFFPAILGVITVLLCGSASAQTPQAHWEELKEQAKQEFVDGDLDKSEQDWRDALTSAEKAGAIEPGLVTCLVGLSFVYDRRGNFAEAERLYELAMRNMEGLVGPTDPRFADWMPDLAFMYDAHGKADKAEVLFKRAVFLKQRAYGGDDLRLAEVLELYAKFLRMHDRQTEATGLELRAHTIRQKVSS